MLFNRTFIALSRLKPSGPVPLKSRSYTDTQLGDVFIKNALTVFSYSHNGAPAVGLQQLVGPGDSTSVAVVSATPVQTPFTTGTGRRTRTGTFTATSFVVGATSTGNSAGKGMGEVREWRGWFGLGVAVLSIGLGAGLVL